MARTAYVVGTARERDRRQETMEPGVDLLVPMERVGGRRWDRIILGMGFNQRMRDASVKERAMLQSWVKNDLQSWLSPGGEMMGDSR